MYMGEPIAQIFPAENGFLVVVADEEAEKKAEAAAKKADNKGSAPYVPLEERQKKLVFPDIGAVVKYLKRELPVLAGDSKADYDESFDEASKEND